MPELRARTRHEPLLWHGTGPARAAAPGPERTPGRLALTAGLSLSAKRNISNSSHLSKTSLGTKEASLVSECLIPVLLLRQIFNQTASLSNDLPCPKHPALRRSPSPCPPGFTYKLPLQYRLLLKEMAIILRVGLYVAGNCHAALIPLHK